MNKRLPIAVGGFLLFSLLAWSSFAVAAPAEKSTPVALTAATRTRLPRTAVTKTPTPRKTATKTPTPTATVDGQINPEGNAPDLQIGAEALTPVAPGVMTSRIVVFNLDTSTATVGIKFYNSSGANLASISPFSVVANGAVAKALPTGIGTGFKGSAVVSSNKNVQAYVTDANGTNTARDEYNGGDGAGSTLTLPLVRHLSKDKQNSVIAVQNTSSTAGNVTLHLYNSNGTEMGTGTAVTVQPSASAYFDTNNLIPSGIFIGSGTLIGDPGLTIAAAEQTKYYKDTASFAGLSSGDQGTTLYLPFVERRRNSTGAILSWNEIFVRNNGGSPTDITLTLFSAAGAQKTPVKRTGIPANGQAQFMLNTSEFAGLTSSTNAYFSGWATITSNGQPISAFALDAQSSGARLFGLSAKPSSRVGPKYACGDAFRITTPAQNSKINLVNFGGTAANVTVKLFKPSNGALGGSKTYPVGVHKLVIVNLTDAAFAAAGTTFEGLAVVSSTSGNVVVSVNTQYASGGITSVDCTKLP